MSTDAAALQDMVAQGDRQAAASWLVERFAGEVLGLCRAVVRDQSAAEDLAQETFTRAFSSVGDYRGEASPRTWLLTIARHRCIDHLRSRQRQLWTLEDDFGDEGAEDPAAWPPELIERRQEVMHALGSLAEGDRALIVLRYRHGLDHAELAQVFGLKAGAVRMRLCRALTKMRDQLTMGPTPATAGPAPGAVPSAVAHRRRRIPTGAPGLRRGTPTREPPPAPAASAAVPPCARPAARKSARGGDGLWGRFRRAVTGTAPSRHPLSVALDASESRPSQAFLARLQVQARGIE